MSKKKRRQLGDQEKVAILKRHLLEKVPISDLCDEHQLYPNQIYDWLKKFFEFGYAAFAQSRNGKERKNVTDAKARKVELLEAKLVRKNEVLAELMEAHCELKKSLGES
jgi:transposase